MFARRFKIGRADRPATGRRFDEPQASDVGADAIKWVNRGVSRELSGMKATNRSTGGRRKRDRRLLKRLQK